MVLLIQCRILRRRARALVVAVSVTASGIAQAQPAAVKGAEAPLRQGDAVIVRLPGDSVVRDMLFVEAGGEVAVPRVGQLFIGGIPAKDVPSYIRQALSGVARGQDAEVRPLRRVTVIGEVLKPGVMYLEPYTTLRDAVASAGAFSTVANSRSITLLREGKTTKIMKWQLSLESSAPIASGDVIAVPREGSLRRNALSVSTSVVLVVATLLASSR